MNQMNEMIKCVESLIREASESKPIDALQLSQAACNAANALVQLQNIKEKVA